MKTLIMACALVAAFCLPAVAEYTVKGSLSCEAAVEEDANQHFREYNKWWLLGYFTARNYIDQTNVGNGIEDDSIYQIALSFCQSSPGNDWDDAAIHTYDLLD